MAETILLVEDDPHVLLSYQEVLKPSGYEVVTADSGEAAERILRTSSIDVVITDRKMPKMGGLEVLRIANQVDPEVIDPHHRLSDRGHGGRSDEVWRMRLFDQAVLSG